MKPQGEALTWRALHQPNASQLGLDVVPDELGLLGAVLVLFDHLEVQLAQQQGHWERALEPRSEHD
jgi:hypothetical protein